MRLTEQIRDLTETSKFDVEGGQKIFDVLKRVLKKRPPRWMPENDWELITRAVLNARPLFGGQRGPIRDTLLRIPLGFDLWDLQEADGLIDYFLIELHKQLGEGWVVEWAREGTEGVLYGGFELDPPGI